MPTYVETSQLIFRVNLLTGFYMRETFAANWLKDPKGIPPWTMWIFSGIFPNFQTNHFVKIFLNSSS